MKQHSTDQPEDVERMVDKVAKNLQAKTRPKDDPYDIYRSFDGAWTWNVLKKWQADDDKPYARWFCNVVTPIVPGGELGDVYVSEIKRHARRIGGRA